MADTESRFARMSRRAAITGAALATMALAACGGGDAGPKTSLAKGPSADSARQIEEAHSLIGPAARAALDTGNTLFRKKDYPGALAAYRRAGDLAPQHAAPIFGIYMIAKATNNTKLADSTLAEIRKRNGPLPETQHGFSDSAITDLHKKLGASKGTSGG